MIIPVQNGNLPQGFCPPDYQSMLNGFSAQQFVDVAAITGIIASSTPPGAADHDKAWLQLDAAGNPIRIYFFNGAWLSMHPLPPGFTMIWTGVLPTLTTFDGGDATVAPFSTVSGQMWQLAATALDGTGTQILQAQFPLGVGTWPVAPAGTGTPIAVGDTGGEQLHYQILTEMIQHQHGASGVGNAFVVAGGSAPKSAGSGPIDNWEFRANTDYAGGDPTTGTPPTKPTGTNNVPPFRGVYFLQRTSRLYYVV